MKSLALASGLALVLFGLGACVSPADGGGHNAHQHGTQAPLLDNAQSSHGTAEDGRQLVAFPEAMRIQTLSNMRDHLMTMGDIQVALAEGSFDTASQLAEQRLGMSSLSEHGAHDVAKFMPQGMQDAGTAMHRSASQLAGVAKDASVTGDLKSVLASLGKVNQTCVACHAAYRLQ